MDQRGFRSHLADCVRLACLMEATSRKPGNVHPAAAFGALCYDDFVTAAEIIAPVIAKTAELGVGQAILDACRTTHEALGRNVNLGVVLLLAPLAAVSVGTPLKEGVAAVLRRLTQRDAALTYEAIRLTRPGGLGRVTEEDVSREPTRSLLEVMRLAADRDAVALQYASRFDLVLGFGVPLLGSRGDFAGCWEEAVIDLHLRLMARQPDTLIARKCGPEIAQRSAAMARDVLAAGWPAQADGRHKLQEFDRWLRADRHRRNPGTTADLVAACLFAALCDAAITPPTFAQIEERAAEIRRESVTNY